MKPRKTACCFSGFQQHTDVNKTISPADRAQMFNALGDETRLRMLGFLRHGELCVCDIMEVLKLPQSTASRHLAYLRNSNWISGARKGKWMYYRLRQNTCEQPVARSIIEFLASIAQIQDDCRVLLQHLETKDEQIRVKG